MKKEEKLIKEYNKTFIGRRIIFFTTFPLFILLILGIYVLILLAIQDEITLEFLIAMNGFIISLMTFCVTQILYWKLVGEYMKSKK